MVFMKMESQNFDNTNCPIIFISKITDTMRTILILFLAFFLFSCQQPIETERITVNLSANPKGLNPLIYLRANDNMVNELLFQSLADYDPVSLEFSPILVKEIKPVIAAPTDEYPEAIKLDIEIKEEAKWDDDRSITGKDVEFTLKAMFLPSSKTPQYKSYGSDIFDVKVNEENEKQVSIFMKKQAINSIETAYGFPILDKAFYDVEGVLNSVEFSDLLDEEAYAQRLDKDALDAYGELFSSTEYSVEKISGAGPYKLKEWLDNQYVIVERKENYWGKDSNNAFLEAIPKEIQLVITPDKAAAFTQLKAGVYDIYEGLTASQLDELKNNETYSSQYNFESVQLLRYYFYILNTRRKELSDLATRQALSYLVNVDSIIMAAENGEGERINSPFLSVDKYSKLKDLPYDTQKAGKLLAEAGWKDTNNNSVLDKVIDGELVELKLNCISTGSQLGQILTGVLMQNAREVGIEIVVENLDRSIYQKRLKSNEFDMTISAKGLSLSPMDPYSQFHTDNTDPGEANSANFGNERSDALIEKIRETLDENKRREMYLELERMIYEDRSYIFLYSPKNKMAIKKNVEGVISVQSPGFDLKTFKRVE